MNLRNFFSLLFNRGGSSDSAAAAVVLDPVAPSAPLVAFQERLGYTFVNLDILVLALTHKSCAAIDDRKGLGSNERLEFLGDAVLNCLVTEHLFDTFPDEAEGHLSKIKSLIVSRKIVGEVGFAVRLEKVITLSASERHSAKAGANPTIVSNAFEAVVGAIYLDAGRSLDPVRAVFERHLYPRIAEFVADGDNVNHKSRILELAQRDGFGIPQYPLLSEDGPDHAKKFVVAVEVAGVRLGEGRGSSKKAAHQDAASHAISAYSKEFITANLSAAAPMQQGEDRES